MKRKVVKGWLSHSESERLKNWSWISFNKKKPETDTNYTVERVTISYELPRKARNRNG